MPEQILICNNGSGNNGSGRMQYCRGNLEKIAETQGVSAADSIVKTAIYECPRCNQFYEQVSKTMLVGEDVITFEPCEEGDWTRQQIVDYVPQLKGKITPWAKAKVINKEENKNDR